MDTIKTYQGQVIEEPKFVVNLFNNTKLSWLWLVLRVWLGWQWVEAATHKIGNPAWVETGAALKGFWSGIVVVPAEGRPAITFDWYRSFIQFMLDTESFVWFGKLVAYGEMIIGIALILGIFTGIFAFFGAFMNWNFMMAGSASSNPMLFVVALGLIFAWKIAGHIGADFFLLRWLGTPWKSKTADVADAG